jgi:hypothetical protein
MSSVFLLGAGFSRAISDRMPMMNELSDAVKDRLDDRNIPGAHTAVSANFEQWLSYLVESAPWLTALEREYHRVGFLEVSRAVFDILTERQREAVEPQTEAPEWLQRLVRYWDETPAKVITFNYDNLVELTWRVYIARSTLDPPHPRRPELWSNLYPVPIPDVGRRFASLLGGVPSKPHGLELFKLHGSLDWKYAGPDRPRDLVYAMGQPHEPHWNAAGFDWGDPSEESAFDLVPMIVPPATVKSAYYNNPSIQAIWARAARELGAADELVMMGFSLPQTDLLVSSMLATTANATIKVTPVNPDSDIVDRVRDTFQIAPGSVRIDTAFAGVDDAIQKWVDANVPALAP